MTNTGCRGDRGSFKKTLLVCIIGCVLGLIIFSGCDLPTTPANAVDPPADTSTIRVFSPNGGESYKIGDTISLRWHANTDSVTAAVLEISFDGGRYWVTLKGTRTIHPYEEDWGTVRLAIPDSLFDWATFAMVPVIPSTECLVQVRDYNRDYLADESDAFFTISAK